MNNPQDLKLWRMKYQIRIMLQLQHKKIDNIVHTVDEATILHILSKYTDRKKYCFTLRNTNGHHE